MKPTILIILALCTLQSQAQQRITKSQYQQMVIQDSYTLKATEQHKVTRQESLKAQKTNLLPRLSMALSGAYQQPHPTGQKDLNAIGEIALEQTIYNGGMTQAQTQYKEIEVERADQMIDQQYWKLRQMADQYYWKYQATRAQLDIAQRYVAIIDSLREIVEIRFRDGYVSRGDLLMVQTRLLDAQRGQIIAQKEYQKALETVVEEGGLQSYNIVLVDQLTMIEERPELLTLEQVLMLRPDYRLLLSDINLQNQNVKITNRSFNPKLSAGVKGVMHNSNLSMPKDYYWQGYLALNTDLFHWGERKKTVSAARSAMQELEYERLQTIDNISLSLTNSYVALVESYSQVEVSGSNLSVAQENLDLNTFSYTEGRRPIIDVLSAQLAWIEAFTAAIDANYQCQMAYSDYEYVVGVGF